MAAGSVPLYGCGRGNRLTRLDSRNLYLCMAVGRGVMRSRNSRTEPVSQTTLTACRRTHTNPDDSERGGSHHPPLHLSDRHWCASSGVALQLRRRHRCHDLRWGHACVPPPSGGSLCCRRGGGACRVVNVWKPRSRQVSPHPLTPCSAFASSLALLAHSRLLS